uniref:RNase H type-1 domain-containing protein n=1 Tax=Glycine max TaxID=3847 RepID=A0A0R0IXX9_SOYBN
MGAIEYANSVGWDKLWLECDSKLVLAAFDKVDLVPWDLRSRWIHCIKLCSQMHFSYSHIYREGNLCANRLANYGIDHRVELIRWDHLPLFVRDSFACNHCGFPSFPLFFIWGVPMLLGCPCPTLRYACYISTKKNHREIHP